jgi:hypothetical protein
LLAAFEDWMKRLIWMAAHEDHYYFWSKILSI